MIFCDCLKVGYIEATSRFLENIGKVLCHETIQTFKGAESQNPVL